MLFEIPGTGEMPSGAETEAGLLNFVLQNPKLIATIVIIIFLVIFIPKLIRSCADVVLSILGNFRGILGFGVLATIIYVIYQMTR